MKTANYKKKTPYAKKSFGQNFLVDQIYIDKIIAELQIRPGETIIEIGPGRGALTEKLVASGAEVVAIELERDMIAYLQQKFAGQNNFHLIEANALTVDFSKLLSPQTAADQPLPVKLVANLPYYISTAILQKLTGERRLFSEMILMFQHEVVERLTATVGHRERGYLTVLTEAFLRTEKLFDVPPTAFRPVPKVRSAVVRLTAKKDEEMPFDGKMLDRHFVFFRDLIGTGFAQKRKTILNNLRNAPPELRNKIGPAEQLLAKTAIAPNRRAESLTLAEWAQILEVCVHSVEKAR